MPPRWTWHGEGVRDASAKNTPLLLADFEGNGRRQVCLDFGLAGGGRRLVTWTPRARRTRVADEMPSQGRSWPAADLDGDGRDELLLQAGDWLDACRGDLGQMWSRPGKE